jgi:hypothetical protein
VLLVSGKHGFDVKEMVLEKIKKNGEKYPVEKSKGTPKKYDELQWLKARGIWRILILLHGY